MTLTLRPTRLLTSAVLVWHSHASRLFTRRAILILGLAALFANSARGQCPAVGFDSTCAVVITVVQTGKTPCPQQGCASISFTGEGPYDNIDDTLVGVVNLTSEPLGSLGLSSNLDIFAFDGDGICGNSTTTGLPFDPRPAGCPFGPTTYEGPGVIFSDILNLDTGTVNFVPPIPPGGSRYFSLENVLTQATACGDAITNSVTPIVAGQTTINATFLSNSNFSYTLAQLAAACGFTAWNWQSTITSWPLPSSLLAATSAPGDFAHALHAPPPFNDPPPSGYLGPSPNAVVLPVYWNLFDIGPESLEDNEIQPFELDFTDSPADICLPGGNVATRMKLIADHEIPLSCLTDGAPGGPKPGSKLGFTTHLVGIVGALPGAAVQDTGVGFSWTDTFNGTSGGIVVSNSINPVDPGSGTGSITITNISYTSAFQYPKTLTILSINGNSIPVPGPPVLLGAGQVSVTASGLAYSRVTQTFDGTLTITNVSSAPISGPFQIVLDSLTLGVVLANATNSFGNWPYITVPAGTLEPGKSASVKVQFQNGSNLAINFSPVPYAGSFN